LTQRRYQATPGRSATSPAAQLDEATTGRKWWSEPMTPPIVTLSEVVYEFSDLERDVLT
jgi:hypothetical protein